MTIDKIKDISLVEYLTDLGYQSHKKIGSNYWFLSPLHKEENPSFKVNSSTNLWYDFALARGGNIINLVQLLNPDMTMHQVLVALSNYSETNQSPQQSYQPLSDQRISHEDDTKIDCIKPIVCICTFCETKCKIRQNNAYIGWFLSNILYLQHLTVIL